MEEFKEGSMINNLRNVLVFVFVLFLFLSNVNAAVLEVGGSGSYTNIQPAIVDAVDGDTVLVNDGTYFENIDFLGKAITVISVNGAQFTKIDGGGIDGSVVTFINGETLNSVLDGFTIMNGSGTFVYYDTYYELYGGGIYCGNSSSPTITNCIITNNSAYYDALGYGCSGDGDGGGIYCGDASSPTITNCTISENLAYWKGGGIACDSSSSPTIANCTISGNKVTACMLQVGGVGGGIYCDSSSSPTITNCTISDNTAFRGNYGGGDGGGIYCRNSNPSITNCTISGNSGHRDGGGIYSTYNASPTITNCTITGNSASSQGGGIALSSSSPTITSSIINNNSAGNGGGIYSNYNASLTITNSMITGNSALSQGGGFYCRDSALTITNCIINSNSASSAGGIYFGVSTPTITNSLISNNSASYRGGAIYGYNSPAMIMNCTISDNSATEYGGGIYSLLSSETIVNTIMWGNTATFGGNEVYIHPHYTNSTTFTYCDIQGGYPGTGNINADPLFVDATNPDPALRDYHLTVGSPCIDMGTDDTITYYSLPLDDIDGDTRPFALARDIGFDEASCSTLASVEVSTDKSIYTPGETVSGDIIFTNNSGVSAYVYAVGKIYNDENLIYQNTNSTMITQGVNAFNLSELFEHLYIPFNALGSCRFEVSVSAPYLLTCIWVDEVVVEVVP
jgi:parallel beta-helix repeat protein/predicted outer membrane repeat protein